MPPQSSTAVPRNLEATKKKFGKNLNKLVKPSSAPPIPKGDKHQNRNGLLLLSTKKSKGLLATSGNSAVKSTPSLENSRASLYDSSTSTHNALLSAVVGAVEASTTAVPDAWGVAAAQQQLKLEQLNEGLMTKSPEVESAKHVAVEKSPSTDSSIMSQPSPKAPPSPAHSASSSAPVVEGNVVAETKWDDRRPPTTGIVWEPESRSARVDESDGGTTTNPVIQLSSYEDRDRGERPSSAPRMLYDPKSGSMVEVKPKDDAAQTKQRKEW
jgi:hypothetical protein